MLLSSRPGALSGLKVVGVGKLKITRPFDPAVPLLGMHSPQMVTWLLRRVDMLLLCSNKKLETTEISTCGGLVKPSMVAPK